MVAAGIAMTDDTAMSIVTVGTCISLLADGVSTCPLLGLKRTKDRSKRLLDPLPPLIDNPWPEGTRQDFFTQVMVSLLLRGNFYGQIVDRDPMGYPTTVMPLHPDRVFARRDERSGKRIYRVMGQPVATEDMLHIPALLVPGSFIGLNPVEYMRTSWSLAAAAERYGGQFFANSANPSGVIQVERDLTEEETLELARSWRMGHQGIANAQLPGVLTGGAKFNAITMSNEDAQFLGTRQFQQQQIISWFRIPPHKVGVTDRSPGPTLTEELESQYVTDALLPWATRIESYFSNLLRPAQTAKFDFSARLRGNTVNRAQAAQIYANIGELTLDELRAREDMEPLPNGLGQVIGRPMNMSYFDVQTGKMLNTPDPSLKPPNPGGLGDGGGDPNNAPGVTQPDGSGSKSAPRFEIHNHVEQPAVSVAPSEVHAHIDARTTVQPADVKVDARTNVAAAKAPDVHIDAPVTVNPPEQKNQTLVVPAANVKIEPAEVNVTVEADRSPRRKRVQRDEHNNITGVIED